MKKKLFRSFIVSLFVFTLFISVSNAFVENEVFTNTGTETYSELSGLGSLSNTEIVNRARNYALDPTNTEKESLFNEVVDLMYQTYGVDVYYLAFYPSVNRIYCNFYNSSEINIGTYYIDDVQYYLYELPSNTTYYQLYCSSTNGTRYFRKRIISDGSVYGSCKRNDCTDFIVPDYSNFVVHNIIGTTIGTDMYWDGTYYNLPTTEPEEPEVPQLTGEEMKAMIDKLQVSEVYKNRLPEGYGDFFIVYNSVVDNYYAYVYPTKYNLAYRYYDWTGSTYVANGLSSGDAIMFLQYDPTKGFSWQKLWNAFVDTLFPFDYYCFRLSSDGETFLYSTQYEINDPAYFDTTEEHIIYSSKRMYLLVNDGVLETEVDEENSIKQTILKDSSGNDIEVSIDESKEYNPVVEALNRLFKELASFIEVVLNGVFNFSDFLLKTFGENVFTLIFSIIIEAFSALVAGISLLVRFAGFILTLVAIPADSSLFNVLVDGSAWGTHFIEGLNCLKGLSWNNLNLWTFFECFVVAIEVIWTVKIVRRHYSQVV